MRKGFVLLLVAGMMGCDGPSVSEPVRQARLTVQAGDGQVGTASALLPELLQVIATDPASGLPLEDVEVQWRVVQGAGAAVASEVTSTLNNGIARTALRLGNAPGVYVIEATTTRLVGSPARFEARVVNPPRIISVTPRTVDAGDTVTIAGENFSTIPDDNVVVFGGFSGRVLSASANELRVVVPLCLPTRRVSVVAQLGTVASAADSVMVNGTAAETLALARGEVRVLSGTDLACMRLSAWQTGQRLLLVAQNTSETPNTSTAFRLSALMQPGVVATSAAAPGFIVRTQDPGSAWEFRLRAQERALPAGEFQPQLPTALRMTPALGDRREFNVINKDNKFTKVTAEVKSVSKHAIIYQDVKAPSGGFNAIQFDTIGGRFDSPTYDVLTRTFGEPSDIDGNGKIIILFTPVVNELTPRGAGGFVAGFYYGCDLLTKQSCSGSNGAEMFYLFVPDPKGAHGDSRTADFVMRGISPVLGHEFQHMIHFGKRRSQDVLWLSEGLAHMAEDLVADEYDRLGQLQLAREFRAQNYERARRYLQDNTRESLIADEAPGSLEVRGASWLLLKYLTGHYGEQVLQRMANSTRSSIANVTDATGTAWPQLLADWSVAVWADNAPELAGTDIDPRYQFPDINLREVLSRGTQDSFTLNPTRVGFADFVIAGQLSASSQRYILMQAGREESVFLNFAGLQGGPFNASAAPQVSVLRY